MDMDIKKVRENVELYFREHLPEYTVLDIKKKSNHPKDCYLWVVSAKKADGSFAVWTSWNELTQSLNYGHYDICSIMDCERMMMDYIDDTIYYAVCKFTPEVRERILMFIVDSEAQARGFCEDHDWEWKDEYGFVWNLGYCEAEDV